MDATQQRNDVRHVVIKKDDKQNMWSFLTTVIPNRVKDMYWSALRYIFSLFI